MDAADELVDVEVEFDYEAELGDELSIKTGDIVKDVKRMEGGWWEGILNGRRGVFPDNFVKVINTNKQAPNSPKAKPKTTAPPSTTTTPSTPTSKASTETETVQMRRGLQSRASANNKKKCRVLFSYQPKHDDELELKMEDVVEFIAEVEDGWWKGKLRGRVGVFPSNFVEMNKSTTTTTTEDDVADKNKRNEKLKVEKVQRPSSKISSLIQEAENKAKSKKTSLENLNLLKRESPLGGEDKKSDDLANAPKLPPKPGLPSAPSPKSTSSVSTISASGPVLAGNSNSWGGPPPPRPPPPTQAWMDDPNNNKKLMRPKKLPLIEVTQNFDSEFDMAPLETVSPCDFLAPLKQDDSVFFVGSLNASSVPKGSPSSFKFGGRIKRVLSAPKSLKGGGGERRKSLSQFFKPKSAAKVSTEVSESFTFENLSSSFNSLSLNNAASSSGTTGSGTKPGSAPGSRKRFRSISISENYPTNITHPHSYEGILKITRSSQTISGDLVGSPSLWSEKFKKKSTTASNKSMDAQTQTDELIRKVPFRSRIVTNPRIRK